MAFISLISACNKLYWLVLQTRQIIDTPHAIYAHLLSYDHQPLKRDVPYH